jgi:hypothetical protein
MKYGKGLVYGKNNFDDFYVWKKRATPTNLPKYLESWNSGSDILDRILVPQDT